MRSKQIKYDLFVIFFSLRHTATTNIKAGVHMKMNEILRGLKEGEKKENYFLNTTSQLIPTQQHTGW